MHSLEHTTRVLQAQQELQVEWKTSPSNRTQDHRFEDHRLLVSPGSMSPLCRGEQIQSSQIRSQVMEDRLSCWGVGPKTQLLALAWWRELHPAGQKGVGMLHRVEQPNSSIEAPLIRTRHIIARCRRLFSAGCGMPYTGPRCTILLDHGVAYIRRSVPGSVD